ncbi:unnamed protein product, partial [Polarella glacialis]
VLLAFAVCFALGVRAGQKGGVCNAGSKPRGVLIATEDESESSGSESSSEDAFLSGRGEPTPFLPASQAGAAVVTRTHTDAALTRTITLAAPTRTTTSAAVLTMPVASAAPTRTTTSAVITNPQTPAVMMKSFVSPMVTKSFVGPVPNLLHR